MDTINALRIGMHKFQCSMSHGNAIQQLFQLSNTAELAEELATLPEVLHSSFPDLAVDFLYTVFQDSYNDKVKK